MSLETLSSYGTSQVETHFRHFGPPANKQHLIASGIMKPAVKEQIARYLTDPKFLIP